MDDELNVPVQFKETKCIFSSCIPTCAELDTCKNFEMTSHNECNPDSVNIRDLMKISQLSKIDTRYIHQTKCDTLFTYPVPTSNHVHDIYSYHDPYSDKAILSEISSILILLKEFCIAQINVRKHSNEQFPAHRTTVPSYLANAMLI